MAHKGKYRKGKGKKVLSKMMQEVHEDMPSTCPEGGCSEKQLRAVAFSKARKKGAKLHKPKPTSAKVFTRGKA